MRYSDPSTAPKRWSRRRTICRLNFSTIGKRSRRDPTRSGLNATPSTRRTAASALDARCTRAPIGPASRSGRTAPSSAAMQPSTRTTFGSIKIERSYPTCPEWTFVSIPRTRTCSRRGGTRRTWRAPAPWRGYAPTFTSTTCQPWIRLIRSRWLKIPSLASSPSLRTADLSGSRSGRSTRSRWYGTGPLRLPKEEGVPRGVPMVPTTKGRPWRRRCDPARLRRRRLIF